MGLMSNLRFAIGRTRARTGPCSHLDEIHDLERRSDGCERCLEVGDTWVHLRQCMVCGIVGCCDSSKNKHAHRHADLASHHIARSIEPGEDWMWCFADETFVEPTPH